MAIPSVRDLEQTRTSLAEWMQSKLPGATDLHVSDLASPTASGFSNETLLFDASWKERGEDKHEALVLRIQPTGYGVFPEYDMGLQYRAMDALAPTDVPVPKMRWLEEENTDVFGSTFYVMDRVKGRVPPDAPPYSMAGWMTEISPEEVAAVWYGGIECLAKIHRVDFRAVGLGFLDRQELGKTGIDQQLEYYERYLAWAARGKPQPTAEAALEWLKQNKPADEPMGIVWGDARIGNIIYDGTRPAAVLDWEMVCAGSPETDLAWILFLDRVLNAIFDGPQLNGLPSREETVARYEELSGHEVKHLHYYEVYAGFRFTVIGIRLAQRGVYYETATEEQGRAGELNSRMAQLTAELLNLPEPSTYLSTS